MTFDLYTSSADGDKCLGNLPESLEVSFQIRADPDPLTLVRVASVLAIATMPPVRAELMTGADGVLIITATFHEMPLRHADLIARKLQQLSCVSEAALIEPRTVCTKRL